MKKGPQEPGNDRRDSVATAHMVASNRQSPRIRVLGRALAQAAPHTGERGRDCTMIGDKTS